MARPRGLLAVVSFVALVVSCAQPKPAPVVAVATPEPVLDTPVVVDPDAVRCGVDDRPKPVGLVAPPRIGPTDLALLGEMAAPTQPPRQEDPRATVVIELGPARLRGGPASPSVTTGMTGAAEPAVCDDLATTDDTGALVLELDMASTAQPLTVRVAGKARRSKYVRCLMERACQVRATSEAASTTLSLALSVRVEPPPPPPPVPPPPPPLASVVVAVDRSTPMVDVIDTQSFNLVQAMANRCATQEVPTGKPLKLRVTMVPLAQASLDGEPPSAVLATPPPTPGAGRRRSAPTLKISEAVSEGKLPAEMRKYVACIAGSLIGSTLGFSGLQKTNRKRSVRYVLTIHAP